MLISHYLLAMMNGPAHEEELRVYEGELAAGRMTAAERRSWWEVLVEVVPAGVPTSNFMTRAVRRWNSQGPAGPLPWQAP
jgi:hypothetical protein